MLRIRAAAQDDRVARLEAERARICRHIRAAFVNHADDAERRAHALDLQTVRAIPGGNDFANRIRQRGNRADAFGNAGDPRIVKRKPVDEGSGKAAIIRCSQIFPVGGKDRFLDASMADAMARSARFF